MSYINIDDTKWCSILEDYKEEWILENKTIFGSFIRIIPTHFRNTILYIEIVILLNKNTKVESSTICTQVYTQWYMKVCVCVSCFSPVWFLVTPWTVAHQPPLSMGFSGQEYWSGYPLLQGIFQTQRLNTRLLCLLHYRQILYPLSHLGSL